MAGLKYSRQREAVLVYLRSTKSHPTAEQVYQKIREKIDRLQKRPDTLQGTWELPFTLPL